MSKMIDLKSGMCRWPFGDPKDTGFHFCGNAGQHFLSYCAKHMAMAHASERQRNLSRSKKTLEGETT